MSDTAPAQDAAGAPEPAAPAKTTRKKAAPKKTAAPAEDDQPVALPTLLMPVPPAEAGLTLDDDPAPNPMPTIDAETFVTEVFAPCKDEFAKARAEADLYVFDPDQLAAREAEQAALPEDQRLPVVLLDLTTPDGMAKAEDQQARFKTLAKTTEVTRKKNKDFFLKTGKLIDERSKTLIEQINDYQNRFGKPIEAELARQEAERERLVQIELERVAALRQRVEDIRAATAQAYGMPAAQVRELIATIDAIATDEASFAEYAAKAADAKADTLRVLAVALTAAARIDEQLAELTRYKSECGPLAPPPAPVLAWPDQEPDEVLTAAAPPDEQAAPVISAWDRGLAIALLMCYRCLTGQSADRAGAVKAAYRMLLNIGYASDQLGAAAPAEATR